MNAVEVLPLGRIVPLVLLVEELLGEGPRLMATWHLGIRMDEGLVQESSTSCWNSIPTWLMNLPEFQKVSRGSLQFTHRNQSLHAGDRNVRRQYKTGVFPWLECSKNHSSLGIRP